MPRARCKRWILDEWLVWYRCDVDLPPAGLAATMVNGLGYFFICQQCKIQKFDDGLIGAYINADGAYLTDSDESESDMR